MSLSTRNRVTQTQLKVGGIVLKLNFKNLSTTGFLGGGELSCAFSHGKGETGELILPVGIRVRKDTQKKTVQSSITSMGLPLLQKPEEMCVDRQIGVTGKFDTKEVEILKRISWCECS